MEKTLFICTDIHGFYDLWMSALSKVGYDKNNPNHILVSLGDLLDRGRQPRECLQFVNSIPKENKILIRGNHEDLLESTCTYRYYSYVDAHNGTTRTCYDLANVPTDTPAKEVITTVWNDKDVQTYYSSLVNYARIKNNIFVHGWIPIDEINNKAISPTKKIAKYKWDRARWFNGMDMWDRGYRLKGKTIFCGHYHTSWGNAYLHHDGVEFLDEVDEHERADFHENFNPFIDDGIVALDACTAYTKQVNVYQLKVDVK